MNDAMTDTERLKYMIAGGIIAGFLLPGLFAMFLGFVCSMFGKKTIGDKLVWFGCLCGVLCFSFGLLAAAWMKRSLYILFLFVATLLIHIVLRKRWKQKKLE